MSPVPKIRRPGQRIGNLWSRLRTNTWLIWGLGDKIQPLTETGEVSSTVEGFAADTASRGSEPTYVSATNPEEQSDPRSETVAPLSHHGNPDAASSHAEQTDDPSSHEQLGIEVAEAPSVPALSVDSEERDDDSALGETSI